MKIKNIILWSFLALVLVGCGAGSSVIVKPEATKNIRSIAILEIQEPFYQVMDLGSSTPWGAVIEVNAAKEIKPKFVALLNKEKFSFNEYLTEELHRTLRKAGYKTYSIKVKRAELYKFVENYKKFSAEKADALLDVVSGTAGYVVEHPLTSAHWRPETKTLVRLVNTLDGNILYQDTVMYGYHNPFMSGVDIDAPKKFHYQKRDDIFAADSAVVVDGLKDAATKVAMHVSMKLKK